MMKPKIREIIVVEGKSDTKKIQLAVDAETIETQGLALAEETIELVKHAEETRGVIVFTDPDYPGETIRKKITQKVPGVKHAFIKTGEGAPKYKGTLGIEHASIDTIREALNGLYHSSEATEPTVSKKLLRDVGLSGGKNAKQLRIQLGEHLRIGYTNSKQLQKRLTLFGISEAEVLEALAEIKEEGFDE